MEGHDLGKVQAVQWGKQHEKVTVLAFETTTGMKVTPAGLYLDLCGFIGVSPDGFVNGDTLIQIKCPFKFRNTSLQQALRNDRSYIVHINEKNERQVNSIHEYWHQIQGALHLTLRNKCLLVIWTPGECEIIEICKDEDWKENIPVLQNFYLTKFVPYILGQ
ncbi:YqaJ-like viral recombinase domain [Popillia japonica]|uniref:YqaJ-like viral recombinase domain n=1 Tax=Popillia japonica TaxID=7064 RepID=A0AAW1JJ54_POPJA